MDDLQANLRLLVEEYSTMANESRRSPEGACELRWDAIETRLVHDAEWTPEGARHLSQLVQEYGSFVLTNAAALAIALNIEDGDAGL